MKSLLRCTLIVSLVAAFASTVDAQVLPGGKLGEIKELEAATEARGDSQKVDALPNAALAESFKRIDQRLDFLEAITKSEHGAVAILPGLAGGGIGASPQIVPGQIGDTVRKLLAIIEKQAVYIKQLEARIEELSGKDQKQ